MIQLSTFRIDKGHFGILAELVQEIVPFSVATEVPLAPPYIKGLINLRGQITPVVSMATIFGVEVQSFGESMNVVCRYQEGLVALNVNEVGDVIEVDPEAFFKPSRNIKKEVSGFLSGLSQTPQEIFGVIALEKVFEYLEANQNIQRNAA